METPGRLTSPPSPSIPHADQHQLADQRFVRVAGQKSSTTFRKTAGRRTVVPKQQATRAGPARIPARAWAGGR